MQGLSPSMNSLARSAPCSTMPTPTYPCPGIFTHTRSPGFSNFKVWLYHAPPPALMYPCSRASFHGRFSGEPKET